MSGLLLFGLGAAVLAAGSEPAALGNDAPELLRPFWVGGVMTGEPVLFIKDDGRNEARASVLFPVEKVISVRNAAGTVEYEVGRDYVWHPGLREIVVPSGSRIVSSTPAELRRPVNTQKHPMGHRDGGADIFFGSLLEYHALQTCITYTHAPDLWRGSVPVFAGRILPRSIAKLRDRQPLSIVVVGDSISAGCNASGWAGGEPFQPPYPELLRRRLVAFYGGGVSLINPSVGGTDTRWVLTMIDKVVAPKPDLVIVAFGMNDASGRSTADYRANTQAVMTKIRERLPEVEFILVASMLGNPDWTRLQPRSFPEFRDALAGLCGPGVALADLTSVWTELLRSKKYWDLTGNGVNHPNDFGHQVYAQVISSLLIPAGEPLASRPRP